MYLQDKLNTKFDLNLKCIQEDRRYNYVKKKERKKWIKFKEKKNKEK